MALVPVGAAEPAEPQLLASEEQAGKNWRSCRHLPGFLFWYPLRRDRSVTPRLSFFERGLLAYF